MKHKYLILITPPTSSYLKRRSKVWIPDQVGNDKCVSPKLNFMSKETKIPFWLMALAAIAAVLHNAFYGFFRIEEPVFFYLTLLFVFGLIISVIYNLLRRLIKTKTKRG